MECEWELNADQKQARRCLWRVFGIIFPPGICSKCILHCEWCITQWKTATNVQLLSTFANAEYHTPGFGSSLSAHLPPSSLSMKCHSHENTDYHIPVHHFQFPSCPLHFSSPLLCLKRKSFNSLHNGQCIERRINYPLYRPSVETQHSCWTKALQRSRIPVQGCKSVILCALFNGGKIRVASRINPNASEGLVKLPTDGSGC